MVGKMKARAAAMSIFDYCYDPSIAIWPLTAVKVTTLRARARERRLPRAG